ncbi:DNA-binding protein WhiA, partial [Bifidobacterium longum]
LRIDHVDKSLEELGKIAEPQITKDAIAGRIRRLLQLAEKTEKARAAEGK